MKKLLLKLSLLLFSITMETVATHAQVMSSQEVDEETTDVQVVDIIKLSDGWTKDNQLYFRVEKHHLKGKTMKELFAALRKRGMNIGLVDMWGTSPWDPKHVGHSYIEEVYLFETDPEDLDVNATVRMMIVTLKEKDIDLDDYLKHYDDDDDMRQRGLEEYHVEDYYFEEFPKE